MIDTGATISLCPVRYYYHNFKKINKSKIKVSPEVRDASNNIIKIIISLELRVSHAIAPHSARCIFHFYEGDTVLFGINVLKALAANLFFKPHGAYLQFSRKEQVLLATGKNIVVPPNKAQEVQLHGTNLENIDYLAVHRAEDEKLVAPQIVKAVNGVVSLIIQNSAHNELLLSDLTVPLYPMHEYFKLDNSKVSGHSNELQSFPNYIPFKEHASHLLGFFSLPLTGRVSQIGHKEVVCNVKEESNSEEEIKEGELFKGNEIAEMREFNTDSLLDTTYRKSYYSEEELKSMFNKYEEEIRDRLVKIFKKHQILAKHDLDFGNLKYKLDFSINPNFEKNTKIYPLSLSDQAELRKMLDLLLCFNVIEKAPPGESFGSPVFLISRKNKTKKRLIIDSRLCFKDCLKDPSSIYMKSVLESLKSKIKTSGKVSCLDLKNAFYNLEVSDNVLNSGVQNFLTIFGCFRSKSVITGAKNSPKLLLSYLAQNLHLDNNDFIDSLEPFTIYHFDDLSCWSSVETPVQSHLDRLEILCSRLDNLGFRVSYEKSDFYIDLTKQQIPLLGFNIAHDKILIPPERCKTLLEIKAPRNLAQAQAFLGLANFMRELAGADFCNDISIISRNLHPFEWTDACQNSFERIRNRLMEKDLYITTPGHDDLIFIFADASGHAIGGGGLAISRTDFGLSTERDIKYKFSYIVHEKLDNYVNKLNIPLKCIKKEIKLYELILNISMLLEGILGETDECIKMNLQREMLVNVPKLAHLVEGATELVNGKGKYYAEPFKQYVSDIINEDLELESRIHLTLLSVSHKLKCNVHLIILGIRGFSNYLEIGENHTNAAIWCYYDDETKLFGLCALSNDFKHFKKTELTLTHESNRRLVKNHLLNNLKNPSETFKKGLKILGFCGKSLNDSLRRASTFTKESAALLFTLNYFQPYFVNNVVIALSDAQAVVKYINGELEWPRDKTKLNRILNEIIITYSDVSILHLSGKDNGISDALSRCLGNSTAKRFKVGESQNWEATENATFFPSTSEYFDFILKLQNNSINENSEKAMYITSSHLDSLFDKYLSIDKQKDAYDNDFLESIKKDGDSEYEIRMDRVYKKESGLPVLPLKLYPIYIAYIHATKGHRGVSMLTRIASKNYYIRDNQLLTKHASDIKSSCLSCLTSLPPNEQYFRGIITSPKPNYMLTLDFIERGGEIKNTKKTLYASYLLIIMCVHSKYTSCVLFNGLKSSSLIHAIFTWISTYGCPKYLLHDNASIFWSIDFQNFLKKFKIKSIKSTPYRSSARGSVENFVLQARNHYRKLSFNDSNNDFDFWEYIPSLISLHNGLPYFENKSPSDLFFQHPFVELSEEGVRKILPTANSLKTSETQKEMFNLIYKRAIKRQSKLNRNLKEKKNTGSFFLIKDIRPRKGEQKNRPYFYEDPYLCLGSNKTILFLVNILDGTQIRRHVSDVKRINTERVENARFFLPEEILEKLNIIDLEKKRKIPAVISKKGVVTRQQRKKEEEISDFDDELLDDLLENEVLFDLNPKYDNED